MPDLPTLTVTTEQANRMLAAYGTVEAYQEWLKNSIIDYVLASEERAREAVFNESQRQKREQGASELGRGPK